jgi:hypothetical protein
MPCTTLCHSRPPRHDQLVAPTSPLCLSVCLAAPTPILQSLPRVCSTRRMNVKPTPHWFSFRALLLAWLSPINYTVWRLPHTATRLTVARAYATHHLAAHPEPPVPVHHVVPTSCARTPWVTHIYLTSPYASRVPHHRSVSAPIPLTSHFLSTSSSTALTGCFLPK